MAFGDFARLDDWMLPPQEPPPSTPTVREALPRMMGALADMRDYYSEANPEKVFGDYDKAVAKRQAYDALPQLDVPQPLYVPSDGVPLDEQIEQDKELAKFFVPTSPLDVGLTIAGGPIGGKLAKGVAIGLGALLEPDSAEAANVSKIRSATSAFDINKPGGGAWYHRIANRKLDRPLQDIPVEYTGRMPSSATQVNPADLEGKFLMPLPGDPTMRGRTIQSIDEVPLSMPFRTLGGRTYIDDLEGFANMPGAATTAAKRVKEYQNKFDTDVIGSYLKMAPQSMDYSQQSWGLLSRMFPNAPMTKQAKKDVDAVVRERIAAIPPTEAMVKKGEEYKWPKFPGVDNQNLEQHLAASPDIYRKTFLNAIEQQRGKIEGVPDVVAARYAVTDPKLLNAPSHSSGLSMTKLTGETRKSKHPDYETHLEGEGAFGLGQQLPREVMFSDLVREYDKRGKPPADWARVLTQTPLTGIPYGQLATPKWVDRTSQYIEDARKFGDTAALDKYLLENFGWK
jgi:hypothetical protein